MDSTFANLPEAAFIHHQGENQAAVAQLMQQVTELRLAEKHRGKVPQARA